MCRSAHEEKAKLPPPPLSSQSMPSCAGNHHHHLATMNLLNLVVLVLVLGFASSVATARKVKVKVKYFKAIKHSKAQKHNKMIVHRNIDQIIANGEKTIDQTLHLLNDFSQANQSHLLEMVKLDLLLYTSVVAALSHCQTQPRHCHLNFTTLHQKIDQMTYYERRIAEELYIIKRLISQEPQFVGNTVSQSELLQRASKLEHQARQLLESNFFFIDQNREIQLDTTGAYYFLQKFITRVAQYRTADWLGHHQVQERQAFERHRQSIERLGRCIKRKCKVVRV